MPLRSLIDASARSTCLRTARLLTVVVICLALFRTLGLLTELWGTWTDYGASPHTTEWRMESNNGGECVVATDPALRSVLAAVAESAAPARGCRMTARQ